MTPDNNNTRLWALVPAAGAGRRMSTNIPKQYLPLADKSVLEHTLDTLLSCRVLAGVVLVLSAGDGYWENIQGRYLDQSLETTIGGTERCHSVLNGLQQLAGRAAEDDWVLVHDAARPCVRLSDIEKLISALSSKTDGGLLGVPVADTMKRADSEQRITATVDREGLWHAYTPQMFRVGQLRAALQHAIDNDLLVTDEASAMEHAGYQPCMVQGQRDNIKITVPADLELAAWYLHARTQV